jgi:hypothetical protein
MGTMGFSLGVKQPGREAGLSLPSSAEIKQTWVNISTLENGVFWDVTSCGSCKNRRFGGT